MAELLIVQRGGLVSDPPPTVGKCWVQNFINRHPELKSKYNRKYDYQRAKCEDPEVIRQWFRRVEGTIAEYGIAKEDIYNFDETGFQMGVIATAKVITGSERAGRPVVTQPGNREWVTIIETANSCGWALPPLIIFEGKVHLSTWYEDGLLPSDWVIGVSDNGWTTDELGFIWLKEIFDKHTRARTIGRYRLLILDGHGSHVTPQFDRFCLENSIIVLCMPPHSSHLLQPLDVGCFSVLKRMYGRRVENCMRLGINHIDKMEFLPIYRQARVESLTENNIRNGFAATGLVPYDPDRVLSRLHVQIRTPTPPTLPQDLSTQWVPETPHNIVELQLQTETIKELLKRRTQSPPTPTDRVLNQLVKGCQMAMHSAVLLADENRQLRAANQRQKRKREKERSCIAKGGVLTAKEGLEYVQRAHERLEAVVKASGLEPRKRAPPRCSVCESLEHNARICPCRQ
jgi:hypothetical protein